MRRLSEDARKSVMGAAVVEVHRRGDRRLGTDHLLLGLLHDPSAADALGVDLETARAADLALDRAALAAVGINAEGLGSTARVADLSRPPLTSGARAAFKRAIDTARVAKAGRIETRHFVLALLECESPDPCAELLRSLEVDPTVVRARLAR